MGILRGVFLLVPPCSVLLFPLCVQGKAHVISGEGTYTQIYAMMLGKKCLIPLRRIFKFYISLERGQYLNLKKYYIM